MLYDKYIQYYLNTVYYTLEIILTWKRNSQWCFVNISHFIPAIVVPERHFYLNDPKQARAWALGLRRKRYYMTRYRPTSFRDDVKICEYLLSREDHVTSLSKRDTAGPRGDGWRENEIPCAGDEIFPKASRKAGRRKRERIFVLSDANPAGRRGRVRDACKMRNGWCTSWNEMVCAARGTS